ncbi:MAG: hypothetical protein JNN07_00740 [Verrucomicrobiales bacterium]|nr:hypothetical protein [Verrucomicrobiales bacterium]
MKRPPNVQRHERGMGLQQQAVKLICGFLVHDVPQHTVSNLGNASKVGLVVVLHVRNRRLETSIAKVRRGSEVTMDTEASAYVRDETVPDALRNLIDEHSVLKVAGPQRSRAPAAFQAKSLTLGRHCSIDMSVKVLGSHHARITAND